MQYVPHPYQSYCIDFLLTHPFAGLFLQPGMGKTSIALTAADRLLFDTLEASRVLVIAPLRVAEDTWSRESAKWDHLSHLRVSKLLGPLKRRREALQTPADVYVINRENVQWLVTELGRDWNFDTVIVDEFSSFRNSQSRRFKALRKVRPRIKRLWGLTGTPRPRSLLDLWAQLYLLDQGDRLGKTLTAYRDRYFRPGKRNGHIVYEWIPRKGAEREITRRISDICVSLETAGNVALPALVESRRAVILPPAVRALCDDLERDYVLSLDGVDLDAGSAAAVSNKLLQIAGGAVYDDAGNVHDIHAEKLEALADVIEESAGEPVLVAYRFRHERDRILARFPEAEPLVDSSTIERWNRGEIPILIAHPAGAGHGLNLQDGGHIIVWFGPMYDLELKEQFNARLYRQGQKHTTSIIYLVAEGTVEESAMEALEKKASAQEAMLKALTVRIDKWKGAKNHVDQVN